MKRKNTNAATHTNRKMDSATYALRRQVMDVIYKAKRVAPNLPRIEVRITDCSRHNVLGTARMGDCVLWIPASTTKRADLERVVLHEILHAAYAIDHSSKCPLMGACVSKATDAAIWAAFQSYLPR